MIKIQSVLDAFILLVFSTAAYALEPIEWQIEPATSSDPPTVHPYVWGHISQPLAGARWYKIERTIDAAGSAVAADSRFPVWTRDVRQNTFAVPGGGSLPASRLDTNGGACFVRTIHG